MPSSINILRYSPFVVLVYRILKISGPYTGCPPVIYIKNNNFSRNSTTTRIHCPIPRLSHIPPPRPRPRPCCISFNNVCCFWPWAYRSNNHQSLSTGHGFRLSCTKFYARMLRVGSSRICAYGIRGNSCSRLIPNTLYTNTSRASRTHSPTVTFNYYIVNSIFLNRICSPTHSI
jgi:hypothetical protein